MPKKSKKKIIFIAGYIFLCFILIALGILTAQYGRSILGWLGGGSILALGLVLMHKLK